MSDLRFTVPQKLVDRMTEKSFKKASRGWNDSPIRVAWIESGKSEKSMLRFTLLHAAGWDEGWAVMEWHRLPGVLRKDLEGLPPEKFSRLLEEDEKRLNE